MKIPELKKEVVKCKTCKNKFLKSNHTHLYCSQCINDRNHSRDSLEYTGEKKTWKYKRPDTISRFTVIRRNKNK